MDIALSIGNSSIRIAARRGMRQDFWRVGVDRRDALEEIPDIFTDLPELVERCIVSSVNPDLTQPVCGAVQPFCRSELIIASLDSGFSLDYSLYEGLLGIDRAICCEAARLLAPPPLIVIDLGTATTFNVVGCGSRFLGGMILPGVRIGLSALSINTSLLPSIQPDADVRLIGRNTRQCMLSGAAYGTALMLDGAISAVWSELEDTGSVVITGGNASFITPLIKTEYIYEENLISTGLFNVLDSICTKEHQ